MVGHRHRVHALLRRRIDQLGDPAETVEQAELRVDVEVGEVVRGQGHREAHGSPPPAPTRVAGIVDPWSHVPQVSTRRFRRARDRCPRGAAGADSASDSGPSRSSSRTSRPRPNCARSAHAACTGCTRGPADGLRRRAGGRARARSRSSADRSRAPTGRRIASAAGVTDTVHHEIAHHFGISDARLHELQVEGGSADAFRACRDRSTVARAPRRARLPASARARGRRDSSTAGTRTPGSRP